MIKTIYILTLTLLICACEPTNPKSDHQENRVQALKFEDRLFLDTNVFVRESYPDRIKVTDSLGKRIYGDGKPTLIIGGYAMIIDNKTQTNKIVSLTKLLTLTYIKEIFILSPNDPAATAIYGSAGQFGIIVMKVTKRKYAKLFRRLELKPNY
ncbi:MAG: hypothetical protein IM572_10435 [Chitinophagaceae bacterium]|jgi:hypothetical protein|nr:hypothetical protein [Chitinophagaceae bacterium]